MQRVFVVALAVCAAGVAHAQSEHQKREPKPPQVAVAPVEYRSAFADYQPYREPALANWREVNDEVKAMGGHAGHLAKPAADSPAPKPPAGGHAGHH